MAELRDRVERASRALARRSGTAVQAPARALVECVAAARGLCRGQEPPDPEAVACLSNGLYELARHPAGRALLGNQLQPWLEDALATARRLASPRDRGYVVGQMALTLADLLRQHGELPRAVALVTEALVPPAAPQLRPFLLALLADLRRSQGAHQAALDLCREGEASLLDRNTGAEAMPSHAWARHTLLTIEARAALDLGLPDQAHRHLAAARALAEQLDEEAQLGTSLLACDVHLASNRPELAMAELARRLADERFAAQPAWQAVLRRRLGAARAMVELAVPRGRRVGAELADGLPLLTAALQDSDLLPADRLATELIVARLCAHRGDLAAAQAHARSAALLSEGILPVDRPGQERASLAALDCRLARLRSAPAADLRAALRSLEDAYAGFLADWSRTPIRVGGVGWLHWGQRREVLGELIRTTLAVHGPEAGSARALDHVLAAQAMTSMARSLAVGVPALARLRDLVLPRGGGALIYVPTPDGTHVFALDRDTLQHTELVAPNALEPWRQRFIDAATRIEDPGAVSPGAEDPEAAGAELCRALLPEPLRKKLLSWHMAALVGCEMLGPIPFEALPLGDGRLLGEAAAVYHLPSLPLACHFAAQAAGAEGVFAKDLLVALGTSRGPAGARLLPDAAPLRIGKEELRRLLLPFADSRASSLDAVTETSLLSALRARPRILQLIAHGVHDPARELPSALWLGAGGPEDGDGLLWPEEVAALAPTPPLVFLSACGSGAGPRRLGDDPLLHLGGAFLMHGTRCVVLARQAVELGATLRLMAVAHARLAAGDAPAEALRAARQEVRTDPALRAPAATCLFQVVGLGHEVR